LLSGHPNRLGCFDYHPNQVTTNPTNTMTATEILKDIIEEAEMRDFNGCPCCLPLIDITISQSTLADLIEAIAPELEPLLEKRLEAVSRKF
jgi:hypothetical protein